MSSAAPEIGHKLDKQDMECKTRHEPVNPVMKRPSVVQFAELS